MPLQRKTSKRKISRRKTRRRQHKNLFRRKRKNITYSLKGGTFMGIKNPWSQSQKQTPPSPPLTEPAAAQAQPPPPQKQEQPQEQPQTSSRPWWFLQPQKPDWERGTTPKDQTYNPRDTPLPEESNSWFSWWDNGSA